MTVPPTDSAPICDACGYDLRGLPAGGRCPECGLAVRAGRPRTMILWPAGLRRTLAAAVGGLLLALVGRLVCGVGLLFAAADVAAAGIGLCAFGGAAAFASLLLAAAKVRQTPLAARVGVWWPLFVSAAAETAWPGALFASRWLGRPVFGASTNGLILAVVGVAAAAGACWAGLLGRLAAADVNGGLARDAATLHVARTAAESVLLVCGGVLVAVDDYSPMSAAPIGCGLITAVVYVILLGGNLATAARVAVTCLRPTYGRLSRSR